MPRDVNLVLDDATVYAAGTTPSTAILTEGGKFALVHMRVTAISTTGDTLDTTIQASRDGGSTWFSIGQFPQIDETEDGLFVSRPVYVPQPEAGQTRTQVRLNHIISAGGAATLSSWLEPLLSLAPPALDEVRLEGLAALT
jgi:hypothetical protein